MGIHRTAHKHGIDALAIIHVLDRAVTVGGLKPDADPPKVLAVGPDPVGNLLEVIWLELADDVELVIRGTALGPTFYDLLPPVEESIHD